MIVHYDKTMAPNRKLLAYVKEVADKNNIPYQCDMFKGGGTDAGMIHTEGIPCIVIGMPVRYIHSSNCFCTLDDYQNAVERTFYLFFNELSMRIIFYNFKANNRLR